MIHVAWASVITVGCLNCLIGGLNLFVAYRNSRASSRLLKLQREIYEKNIRPLPWQ